MSEQPFGGNTMGAAQSAAGAPPRLQRGVVRQVEPVSFGEWMLTMLLVSIPIANIILLFIWAFGSGIPENKANWAKATIVWMLILLLPILLSVGSLFFFAANAGVVSPFVYAL